MFLLDELPAPFDKEKHMEPIGKEHQTFLHAQWIEAQQQANNVGLFHEAEMEAGTPLSPGGASVDSPQFASLPHSKHDDPVSEQSPDAGSANEWDGGFAKKG
jgi:hypothetical protein